VLALTGVEVSVSLLCHWEHGYHLPTLEFNDVVVKLDALFNAGGKLLNDWKAVGLRLALRILERITPTAVSGVGGLQADKPARTAAQ
jgi:hypothetical protein